MEKVKIDGIPIEDYGKPTSRSNYFDNINFMQLVPAGFYPDINTDYLKNLKRSNYGTRYRKSI